MQNNEFEKILQAISDWTAERRAQIPQSPAQLEGNGVPDLASGGPAEPVAAMDALVSQVAHQATTQITVQTIAPSETIPAALNSGAAQQPSEAGATGDPKEVTSREQVDEIARLNAQLDQLRRITTVQSEAIAQNTKALGESSIQSKAQAQSAGQSTAGKVLSTVLGTGFGVSSLISGIIGLFGNKSSTEPAVLPTYSLPPPVRFESGLTATGGLARVSYSQSGTPRAESTPIPQQVTVQIQALDSRSVLDRSDDIARAVREAMLHSHSLNDVVSDL